MKTNSSKRVLVIAPSRKTRGGITSVVKAYTETPIWDKWACTWIETHIDRSPLHKIGFFLNGYLHFLRVVSQYSIVHIHFSEPVSAIRKLFFFQVSRWLGKKTILHFHSFSIETTLNGRFPGLYAYLFSRADLVLALSPTWKKAIEGKYPGKCRVQVLYNPYKTQEKPTARLDRQNHILFAGTLNARKGYADLIQAFGKIHERFPDWKLIFAGNGEIDQAKALAESLGISGKVEFLGWISGETKHSTFYKASVFCLPSYAEGFPMAVIDAISYGLPVVTTPVGGILDVFEDGRDVLIAEPGQTDQLAQCLSLVMEKPELRSRLSSQSMEILEKKFELSIIARELDNIYESLS